MFVERPGEQGGSEGRGAPLGRGRRHLEFYIHQLVERVLNPIVGIVGAPQLALGNDMRSRPPGFAGSFGDQKSQGFAGCEGGRCTRTEPCFDELARSEEHTSELQSLMRISYAVFCLKKKKITAIHSQLILS